MASDDLSPLDRSGKVQKAEAGDIDIKAFDIPNDTDYATWDYHAIIRIFTGQGDLVRAGTPHTPWDNRGIPDPQTLYRAAAVLADTGSAIGRTRGELSALATSLNNGDWWSGPAASAIGNVLVQADNVLYDHESILYDHGDNLNSAAASLRDTANYINTVLQDGRVVLENWWNGLTANQRRSWIYVGFKPPVGPGGVRYDDYPELTNGMTVRMREALSNLAVAYRTGIANMPSPGPANLQGTGGGADNFNPLSPGLTDPPGMPGLDGSLDPGAPGMPGLDGSLDPGAPGMPGLDGSLDPGAPGMPGLDGSLDPGAPGMPGLDGSLDPGAPGMPGLDGSLDPGAPGMPGLDGSLDPGAPGMPGLDGSLDPGAPGMPGLDGSLDPGAPGMPGLDAGGFGGLGGSSGPGASVPMPPGLDTAGPTGLGDVTGPGGAFSPSGAPGSPGGAPGLGAVPLPMPVLGGTQRPTSPSRTRPSSVTPPTAPNFGELAAGTNLPNGRIGAPNTGIPKPPSSLPGLGGSAPRTPGMPSLPGLGGSAPRTPGMPSLPGLGGSAPRTPGMPSLPGLDGRLPGASGPGPLGSSLAGPVGKLTPQQAAFSDLLKSNPQVAGLSTGSVKGPTAPEFGGPGGLGSRGGPGTTAGGPGMPGAQGAAEAAKVASAARTAAAESGMLRGATAANGTHPGGMPYMPMGGMGGTPMGAGQRGGERERTTWLTEDEDTWGADCDTSDGVIGRPRPDRPPQR